MNGIVLASEIEQMHLERALSSYVMRCGRDVVPDSIVALADELAAKLRHPQPSAASAVAVPIDVAQGGLMTHTEAAHHLEVSRRTISRHVADGRLVTQGRRVTRASVVAFARGER